MTCPNLSLVVKQDVRGHGGAVVAHSPPISEVGGSNPRPFLGKWVVTY